MVNIKVLHHQHSSTIPRWTENVKHERTQFSKQHQKYSKDISMYVNVRGWFNEMNLVPNKQKLKRMVRVTENKTARAQNSRLCFLLN